MWKQISGMIVVAVGVWLYAAWRTPVEAQGATSGRFQMVSCPPVAGDHQFQDACVWVLDTTNGQVLAYEATQHQNADGSWVRGFVTLHDMGTGTVKVK
jgi:hypothetical protein